MGRRYWTVLFSVVGFEIKFLHQMFEASSQTPSNINNTMPIIEIRLITQLIMPQIIPPLVFPSPSGSICPALIFFRSFFPMIQAGIPVKIPHITKLKMPNTRIKVPRWGSKLLWDVLGGRVVFDFLAANKQEIATNTPAKLPDNQAPCRMIY